MAILCRFITLLKLALLAFLIGLVVGFWAGQQVPPPPPAPVEAIRAVVPEKPGPIVSEGGEFNGAAYPHHRGRAGLGPEPARLRTQSSG
jgi:hypothetical protein